MPRINPAPGGQALVIHEPVTTNARQMRIPGSDVGVECRLSFAGMVATTFQALFLLAYPLALCLLLGFDFLFGAATGDGQSARRGARHLERVVRLELGLALPAAFHPPIPAN